jgi:uroporphyrinogen-III synthase/uroporphyrinogen III methyltransferase/synthase
VTAAEATTAAPLAGLRVLVPRATEGPDPLVIALHAAGAEPVVVPLIQTVPPEDPT